MIETNAKDIISIVNNINSSSNFKKQHMNFEDIKNKSTGYDDDLSFRILSKSSYINFKEMTIISTKCEILKSKAIKKYQSKVSRQKLYNVWVDRNRANLRKIIKKEIKAMIKKLKIKF